MSHIALMAKSRIDHGDASPLDITWYASRFAPDFIYDRPFGTGDGMIQFFHFRNEVVLLDKDGERARGAGCAIFYPPETPQRFQGPGVSGKPLLCDHVCFPAAAEGRLRKLGIPLHRAFIVTNPQPVMATILNLRTEERKTEEHWQDIAGAYRKVLILQLAREVARHVATPSSERKLRGEQDIRDVCAMIERNPARHWVVAELAKTVNMSRSHFTAVFKQVTGVSPQEYAINARLHEACMLLTNTSLSIGQIAERCGFYSAYYLSRLFSQRIGCPPSQYADRFKVTPE